VITENEYLELKKYFKQISYFTRIDTLKCAEYYAGWWKFEYEEGKPSKEIVFNSLGLEEYYTTPEAFFQSAKNGGYRLGLKWIRNENTLYFRTLLLQGRIPIKSLKRFNNYWKKFLIKVIEKRPNDINDISNDLNIISLLPLSTRNDGVYESAIEISKAIWDDSEEGKKVLEILEQNDQEDLINSLRTEKEKIRSRKHSLIKIKPFWELNVLSDNKAEISMKLDLPNKLVKEAFANLISVELNDIANSYNLFCDDYLHATYKKNLNGDYLRYTTSNVPMLWNSNMDKIPLIFFANNEGTKYYIANQLKTVPSPSNNSFWVPMEENRWMMIPGNTFKGEKAFLLTKDIQLLDNLRPYCFNIENYPVCLYEINDNTVATINDKLSTNFQLNKSNFDWAIISDMPDWLYRASMLVVKKMPTIYFYDEDYNNIPQSQINISWRKKCEIFWKSEKVIPNGIVELRFLYNDLEEFDRLFNIGNFSFKYINNNVLTADIYFQHELLHLSIYKNDLFELNSNEANKIILEFNNTNQIPKKIKGVISYKNEALQIEILAPSKGVDIVDIGDKIIKSKHVFILNNLFGFRIVCSDNQIIKFRNQQYPDIVIRQKLNEGLIPLRNFQGIIQKLFLLADSMNETNRVAMEVAGKIYFFQTYNSGLKFKNEDNLLLYTEDNRLLIQIVKNELEDFNLLDSNCTLFAVPLNCPASNIDVIELEKVVDGYSFPISIKDNEFIVFDYNREINCKILPTYVSTIQGNFIEAIEYGMLKEKKNMRITSFAASLSDSEINDEEWKKLYRYIKICNLFNIPFSAFDNIRASCISSELAAKLFFYILCYTESNIEFNEYCEKLEDELGFRFHWCSYNSIESAINWIFAAWPNLQIADIFTKAQLHLEAKYLNYDESDWEINTHLNTDINNMRARLGEAIINELPFRKPWLKEESKNLIPFPNEIPKLKIMARCPVAIGLMKRDFYSRDLPVNDYKFDIWDSNNHEVRRNIIYCQQLDPEWYELAVTYTINKLK